MSTAIGAFTDHRNYIRSLAEDVMAHKLTFQEAAAQITSRTERSPQAVRLLLGRTIHNMQRAQREDAMTGGAQKETTPTGRPRRRTLNVIVREASVVSQELRRKRGEHASMNRQINDLEVRLHDLHKEMGQYLGVEQ